MTTVITSPGRRAANRVGSGMSRRGFLKQSSLIAAGAMAAGLFAPRSDAATKFPMAESTYGKVRGVDNAGINTFRGIHYGANTAGPNRFMPPVKPAKWTGVCDAFAYGPASPQMPGDPTSPYNQAVNWDAHIKSGISEDCLVLNVWTPGLGDGGKRPIFFYIHGGGYSTGSGGYTFDGDPLARLGNAVVVTVNHRLGSLGFTDLSGLSPKFASSGVVGMMDLVAALEWVRDNAANFGGDPGNVMIFGQSGGGSKVSTLMVMPSAKGLFHKAGVQSGSTLTLGPKERASQAGMALAEALGISKDKPDEIQNLPWTTILEGHGGGGGGPSVDGTIIPRNPFDPTAPDVSADVPMIIGYTREDAGSHALDASALTEDGLQTWAAQRYGDKAKNILGGYKKAYPSATPFQIQARISTDSGTRNRAITQAERKSALKKGAAYLYEMDWASPAFEGRFGATHGTDLGLILANPRDGITGNGVEGRKMAEMVGSAVVAFGKTGNPNCDKIPTWKPYDTETRCTMCFDVNPKAVNDPTKELRQLWERA